MVDAADAGRAGRAVGTAGKKTAGAAGVRGTVRLSADLPVSDGELLARLAAETSSNKVTTLVRAIRVLGELLRAERAGGELTITYADGRRERLRFL